MKKEQKVYYRPKEASALMSVCDNTIFNYIKDGKLKAHKPSPRVTLIHIDSINRLLNNVEVA